MTTEAAWSTSCLSFTLQREGGSKLSTDRKDPGNWTGGKVNKGKFVGTKYGIAAASHPGVDIARLTLAQATDIYWNEYVVAPKFTGLDLPLLLVTFDAGVNCGPVRAARWLLEAQKEKGIKAQVTKLTALNLAYHKSMSTWSRYGKAWGTRIADCQKQALLLIAAAPVAVPALAVAKPATAVPKAAHQPAASAWTMFWRGLADALFQPIPKGATT